MEEEVVMAVEAARCGDAARGKNGVMVVEKVGGRSTPTRCFSRYPLKLIIPSKAGVADSDAVWVYTVSFGGGIVSGDRISFDVRIGNDCTAVIKTQSSTKVVLEDCMDSTVADRMHNYQVTAMLILVGPKLKQIQNQITNDVKETMSRLFQLPFAARSCYNKRQKSQHTIENPDFLASCSGFGNKDIGLIVRIMAMTTESVYKFLQQHLACLASLLGAVPYS